MNFANLLYLREEISLIVVMVVLLVFDLFAAGKGRSYFHLIACLLLGIHIVVNVVPMPDARAFGGMYISSPIMSVMKTILSVGTLIIFMQARNWLNREDTVIKQGILFFDADDSVGNVFYDFFREFPVVFYWIGDGFRTDGCFGRF
jgi:NADH-quinone oxidoreductase subunit N